MPQVTLDSTAGTLTIVLPVSKTPQASSSGKSLIVASTRGNLPTTVEVNGSPLIVAVNAYVKA